MNEDQPQQPLDVGPKYRSKKYGWSPLGLYTEEAKKKHNRKMARRRYLINKYKKLTRGFLYPPEMIDYTVEQEYNASDENLPKEVRKHINRVEKQTWNDVEPRWRAEDPRKRQSWQEFLRDFLGQNYGAIAQSMLELYQNDKTQFMKFVMEMGKQGHPQAMQIEMNGTVKTDDIYNKLQAMAEMSKMIPVGVPEPATFDIVDPQRELSQYQQEQDYRQQIQDVQADLLSQFEQNNDINNQ